MIRRMTNNEARLNQAYEDFRTELRALRSLHAHQEQRLYEAHKSKLNELSLRVGNDRFPGDPEDTS